MREDRDAGQTRFPYGAGFRSLTAETPAPVALAVTARCPSWLKGTLLRTGPSKFEVGARTYNHWFDGLAMLHRFALADGGVTYANRFLESKAFRAAEDDRQDLLRRVRHRPLPHSVRARRRDLRSQAHRQLLRQCLATMRARSSPSPRRRCRCASRRTRSRRSACSAIAEALKGQVSTAHPHYDAKRACHYNYIADFGMKSVYRLCRIGDDGKQRARRRDSRRAPGLYAQLRHERGSPRSSPSSRWW